MHEENSPVSEASKDFLGWIEGIGKSVAAKAKFLPKTERGQNCEPPLQLISLV